MTDLPEIGRLSDVLAEMLDLAESGTRGFETERLRLGLPLEMSVRRPGGVGTVPEIRGEPTSQHYRTSVMPVLHRLELRVRWHGRPGGRGARRAPPDGEGPGD
ncbi:hypothetical protein [Tranquillimonas alkanivorans]|uniref:Uncharacterized protein n=1 Tax=Tranquillimonas alkanivorans TaxID=441119 RepID=A0A1I5RAD6_9RHOB|nr:hypothetical protein [Tranquillimonas alkanivorans]SFP55453.1 hypothetical protein SAMN04488047_10875 [Tranquillimonas alkanivorans]